jgi:prepilin-type N-terminal cleavage/methylation domain-containing protein
VIRARRRRGARARAGSERGFTLVELTVSLVAGLIVAMGIVALSREATRTFHEEVRSSAAEATLRTAIDRLRADLQRAGYMSTGNISGDPMIAKAPGQTNWANYGTGMAGIQRLASIRFLPGGSLKNGLPLSAVQNPALSPDAIEIGGNMSSAEQFEVELIQPPSGNCQRILLSAVSASMFRVTPVGDTQPAQELRNVFQPVPATLSTQFMVRLVDDTGHEQFLATCPEAAAAGYAGTQPYVEIDATSTPIQTAQQTKTNGGVSGYASGRALVNPVQIVHWEIASATQEGAAEQAALDNVSTQFGAVDPNKYDLVRSYVDALGNVVPQSSEIVAEYAVDLGFAFSVDQGTSATSPAIVTYAFGDNKNSLWSQDVTHQTVPYTPGPQRIRAVRTRLVTRTQLPDRAANVPVTPAWTNDPYLYRYCVNPNPSCLTNDGALRWARTRTVTTEVSLPNDARNFF